MQNAERSGSCAWQMETSDGKAIIAVPACCEEWANVTVCLKDEYARYQKGGQVQHRLTLPDLRRCWKPTHPREMADEVFDAYVQANRVRLIALIAKLNAPVYARMR